MLGVRMHLYPMKRLIFFLTFLFLSTSYSIGQTSRVLNNVSPKVKWYQINTANFKVIYPEGFSEQGQRMANTMEHIYTPVSASLGISPKKNFPLILQNHTTVSNGFVTLGPRRSEFFTMSPQRPALLGNNDWLSMLALHEFRHVVQFDKSRTGFTGFLRNIFGEYTQAAVASATVPSWYWEGDAVVIETALSKSGRGRIPEFSAAFRANLLEKGSFNYNKAYLRSYKDFIPSHYVLGYHYTNYLRQQYGSESVEKMVNRTWAQPYIPFGFSFAQKKFADKKMPEMYQSMMTDLKVKWEAQQKNIELTPFEKVNSSKKKVYTRYDYPQLLDNGNLVVLKSGLGDYPQLVEVNVESGKESKIFVPGLINSAGMLSARSGSIVWNEYEFDARWRQENYTVIKVYSYGSRTLRQVSTKSRYNASSLSENRELIATIEQKEDYSNSLVVLDAFSGEIEYTFNWPQNTGLTNPVWTDNENIVVAEIKDGMKRIVEINILNGQVTELLRPTTEQISYSFRKDNLLYYVSGLTGIDNIYIKDLDSEEKYQVTSSQFGAYSPTVNEDGIMFYNELNSLGTDLVKVKLDRSQWTNIENLTESDIKLFESVVEQEANPDLLENVPNKEFVESRYRKKLGKLHSWGPYLTSSAYELEAGLYSTNLLSTTDLFVGFRADTDLNFKWIARASFQALYPIIDVQVDYLKRKGNSAYLARDPADSSINVYPDKHNWDESGIRTGLRIPWLLTSSKFQTSLEVRNYVGYTLVRNFNSEAFGNNYYQFFLNFNAPRYDGNLISNEFRLNFYSLHNQSKRDINSKWGVVFNLERFGTPYGGDFEGGLTALWAQVYVPGLIKHHSLNFFGGYQHNKITLDDNNYWFANRMPYPRGVTGDSHENFYTFRANYDLPLLHPDLSIGPWLYIQRVKAKLFYDIGYGSQNEINDGSTGLSIGASQTTYYSTGAELSFEFNFMRALPLLELGVRYAYLPDRSSSSVEFIVGSFAF